MFVGLREIRAANGRFTLMSAVVGMITLLLVMLTGLTAGLGAQNTAGLEAVDPERYVFGATSSDETPEDLSFVESFVTSQDQQAWQATSGVTQTVPIGMSQTDRKSVV